MLVVGYRKSWAEFLHMVFGTWSGETDADFIPIKFPRCTFSNQRRGLHFCRTLPERSLWSVRIPWRWDDVRRSTSLRFLHKKGPQKSLDDCYWKIGRHTPPNIIYIYVCVLLCWMHLCPHDLKHTSWESQPITKAWEHPWTNSIPPRPSQWEQLEALLHSKGGDLSRSFC